MSADHCGECRSRLIPEWIHCPHCGRETDPQLPTEVRCECGCLLCKLTEDALEIKCRRCRRLIQLPFEALPEIFLQRKKERQKQAPSAAEHRPRQPRLQMCQKCGQLKPGLLYGKCIDCRTEDIKVQYRSKVR